MSGPMLKEMERLYAIEDENERLHDALETCRELRKYDAAENERLRAERDKLREALLGEAPNRYWEGRWRSADAEIERLRAQVTDLDNEIIRRCLQIDDAANIIADLTGALRDTIETMKRANNDAFCNGVVHQSRDEGDVLAGQVIDRGLAALTRAQGEKE